MIVSLYNHKVNPLVVEWQKKVFDHFGIPLKQIDYGDMQYATGHAMAIDNWLKENKWDTVTIMDIDCIPVRTHPFDDINYSVLTGAAQKASHIPGSLIYAGPCFCAFSKETFEALGRPSFLPTERGDVGAELTYIAREKGIEVRLLYPTHVEQPEWELDGPIKFGYGTTYGNRIYHSFGGHWNTEMFIKKCKEVIGWKD